MKLYENHEKNKEINGKLIRGSVKFSWKRWQLGEKLRFIAYFLSLILYGILENPKLSKTMKFSNYF